MKVVLKGKQGQFIKASNAIEQVMATANTGAIRQTAGKMMNAARSSVGQAGFGKEWQKSFLFAMRPKRGTALNPWAWLHSSLNFAAVFEGGGHPAIEPLKRHWLWLPLPTVPLYPNTGKGRIPLRQMDPAKYIHTIGPLKFAAHREGKAPILLGLIRTTTVARSWLFAKKPKRGGLGSRAKGATEQWVPMFVGVLSAKLKKHFNAVPAMLTASKELQSIYRKAFDDAKLGAGIADGK